MLLMLSMDGPEAFDARLAGPLTNSAAVVVASASVVLAGAILAEALRRAQRLPRAVALLDRLTPVAARRVAVAVLGVLSVTLTAPAPAHGDSSVRGWLTGSPTTTSTTFGGAATDAAGSEPGPTDRGTPPATRPLVAPVVPPVAPPEASSAGSSPASPIHRYVVVPGDCLWSIAARALGGDPDASAVDRAWRGIYTVNRVAIGSDPGLIHPGLELLLPPPLAL